MTLGGGEKRAKINGNTIRRQYRTPVLPGGELMTIINALRTRDSEKQ